MVLGISEHARRRPDKPALVEGDRVVTFAELDERTTRLAHALEARGIGPGNRVAVMLANSIEFFEVWGAASKLDAPVVLVNWHLKREELSYILEDSGAALLVAHADLLEFAEPAAKAVGCALLLVGRGDAYEGAISAAKAEPALDLVSLASPIFYTSGTTGRPKGAMLTHLSLVHSSMHYQVAMGLGPTDCSVATVPLSHVTGLVAL
ncbi:MAG: AMP-binding protein, partial [Actinomycetota bacterium]